MRIHTKLTRDKIRAAVPTGLDADISEHGSRRSDRAFEVRLLAYAGAGRRQTNSGRYGAGGDHAATWDEWGYFLQAIFDQDPQAVAGSYDGYDDFEYKTDGMYRESVPGRCMNHRWETEPGGGEQHCKKCDAVRRWR